MYLPSNQMNSRNYNTYMYYGQTDGRTNRQIQQGFKVPKCMIRNLKLKIIKIENSKNVM